MIQLYNTLTRSKAPFMPQKPGHVSLYACGPTVYHYAHIGNFRTYLFVDFLVKCMRHSGLKVDHVMNITDVGHLESDGDEGDDKMAIASKREQKSPWDIAKHYESVFFKDAESLHIAKPDTVCRATDHIGHMIAFIQKLEAKGYTYTVDGNVYFSIDLCPHYTELSRRNLEELQEGARVEVDRNKKNPLDFVLWFSQSKYPNQIMQWDSPWGRGFPGWHIECSAMASHYLGDSLDIHCGGIDHIPVHHTNEIAQSDCCFDKRWVDVWMHCEFLVLKDGKMSKSKGSFTTIGDLVKEGFSPLHYRYLCFSSHYRSPLFYSTESLTGAKNAFEGLKNRFLSWSFETGDKTKPLSEKAKDYQKAFWDALYDDLNCPTALAVLWEAAKSTELSAFDKKALLLDFDQILTFNFATMEPPKLCEAHSQLIKAREAARAEKDFAKSDAIRDELKAAGIELKDGPNGTFWYQQYKD